MQRQNLDDQLASMHSAVTHQADLRKLRLAGIMHRLNSVNPSSVLNRGYAIVTNQESGHIVTSVRQVVKGDKINIRVKDGGFNAVAGEEG
jgi:exodeoxyribonuclease VII large subunit